MQARSFQILNIKTDEVIADAPLQQVDDLSRVKNGYSAASFVLPLGQKSTPTDWRGTINQLECYVGVFDRRLPQPLWGGVVIDRPTEGLGSVGIDTLTFEFLFSANAYVGNHRFDMVDEGEIIRTILEEYEAGGGGINLLLDVPNTGVKRTMYFDTTEPKTIGDVLDEMGFEWNIFLRWADASKEGVRKVFSAKKVTAIDMEPNIAFELDGPASNIGTYNYTSPANGGEIATRLRVYGQGSGKAQVRSRLYIDEEAELLIPRREVHIDADVMTTDDANAYLDFIKPDYLARRDAVTLAARDNGATSFADIMDMEPSALVSINRDELKFRDVTRIGGWTVGSDISVFTPTLIKLPVGSVKFPKTADPSVDTSDRELKDAIQKVATKDPFKQGYDYGLSNGNQIKMDDSGLGVYDSEGNPLGGFDSSGKGFGGGGGFGGGSGGGTSSAGSLGVVESYNATDMTAEVLVDGATDPTHCKVSMDRAILYAGDVVAVVAGSPDSLVVSRRKLSATPGTPPIDYRSTIGWPKNAAILNLPYGVSFVDEYDAFQYGPDCIIIDTTANNNCYRPSSGETVTMSPPGGYGFLSGVRHVYNNEGFHWFLDSKGQPRLFKRDTTALSGWRLLNVMPATAGGNSTGAGYWSATSTSKEIFSRPLAVSARATATQMSGSAATGWKVPMQITLHAYNAITGAMDTQIFAYDFPTALSSSTTQSINPAIKPLITTYSNGNHVVFAMKLDDYFSTADTGEQLFYVNLTSPTGLEVIGTSVASYLGTSYSIRISEDGKMYGTYGGFLYTRGLTDAGFVETQYDSIPDIHKAYAIGLAQRDRLTDRYFIAARTYMAASASEFCGVVFDVDTSTGNVITMTPRTTIPADNQTPAVAFPTQSPTGLVIANLDGTGDHANYNGDQGLVYGQGFEHFVYKLEAV